MKNVQTQKAGKAKIVPFSTAPTGVAKMSKTGAIRPEHGASPDTLPQITHELISERARSIWKSKGCPSGQDEQIWLRAESELRLERAER